MNWNKFFIRLFFFALIQIFAWIISLISIESSPCNIGLKGEFNRSGLAEHVQQAINGKYSEVYASQYGCAIDFTGIGVSESIKSELKDIAKSVLVRKPNGRIFYPVTDVSFSELLITSQKSDSQRLRDLEIAHHKNKIILNTVWVLFCGALVFFMNAGFALLEAGFCRYKNSTTILAKNLVVFGLTAVAFWFLGFGFMFGNGNSFIGASGLFLFSPSENSPTIGDNYQGVFDALNWAAIPLGAKFFFQLTFASAAVTIVSGAVAERIKFKSFFLFIPLFVIFSYAITGHWIWGGGWLQQLGFWDFAGSTTVHLVGGLAGLIGTLFLGPRIGKYKGVERNFFRTLDFKQKTFFGLYEIRSVRSNNLGFSTLGCLILWLGWFGFNAGSTLEANFTSITHIFLGTVIAGSCGSLGALIGAWIYFEKPSIASLINGILGGCVSITASCAFVGLPSAAIIGFIGGLLVNFFTVLLDKLKIDDPVGAVPVHFGCGFWGTISVGLFSEGLKMYKRYGINQGPCTGLLLGGNFSESLYPQIIGIFGTILYSVIISITLWLIVRVISGGELRISEEEERRGTNREFEERS